MVKLDKDEYFFREWVEVLEDEDTVEAITYLKLWMKYFQRKVPDLKLIDSQIVYRRKDPELGIEKSTVGCKILMKGEKLSNVMCLSDLPTN